MNDLMARLRGGRILVTGGSGFIGTDVVQRLSAAEVPVLNLDVAEPLEERHRPFWRRCSILDTGSLREAFETFRPTGVIHLAARATMKGRSLDDFPENIQGTRNVVGAVSRCPTASRLVVASSQHVRKPGSPPPAGDEDFDPYELYGRSKVLTERITREEAADCVWTIVRPTAIWGPWHPVHVEGLWSVMSRGWYFHPGGRKVIRGFGFVGNATWQMLRILDSESGDVDRRVFYVGDPLIDQMEWLNAFSRALCGRDVRHVPWPLVRVAAWVGDLFTMAGLKAPIFTARYRNLTTSNPVPMNASLEVLGTGPFSLQEGIDITVRWLRDRDHLS